MKVRNRRRFMHLAAGVFAQSALSCFAWAQTYPTRPVRLIVGYEPGGSSDLFARLIGQWLSERLGQRFITENRPGAGGNLATEVVVRAPSRRLHVTYDDYRECVEHVTFRQTEFQSHSRHRADSNH
jgi:tripartite-type tricarboxylate transporter receptor subunit TctC